MKLGLAALFVAFVIVSAIWFKLGAWYGHEKAVVEFQSRPYFSDIMDVSTSKYYSQLIIKNCLIENRILKDK